MAGALPNKSVNTACICPVLYGVRNTPDVPPVILIHKAGFCQAIQNCSQADKPAHCGLGV